MQCPVKTPGPQLCPGFWNFQVKYFVALASLVYLFFFPVPLRAVLSRGQPCQTHPSRLVIFSVFLADAYGKAGIAHPKTPVLCGAGSDSSQVCERNYFCRKNLVLRFFFFFRKIGDKKEKLFSKTAFLILHAGVFCWIL